MDYKKACKILNIQEKHTETSVKKAYHKLGWKSIIDTEDLVNLTVKWYKSFYNKNDVEKLSIEQILYYKELGIKNNLEWAK